VGVRSAGPQLPLALLDPRRWGGRRPGAGRKPGPQPRVPHRARPRFPGRHPAHVTLKVRPDVPSLRTIRLVHEIERSFAAACDRGDFRLVHYSLQSNHAHLIVEAAGPEALARGMGAIGARLARAVNRVFSRQGRVLAERFHMRVLATPREVRRALAYVLLNARRHAKNVLRGVGLDPASSARWFHGWRYVPPAAELAQKGPPPVAQARTWLVTKGWQRHGLLDPAERPGGWQPTHPRVPARRQGG